MTTLRLSLALLCSLACAQVPDQDRRNTTTPDTDTHFQMPEYRTAEQWRARSAHLRKQILTAAGLYPLPSKPPLRTLVFGRIENADYSIEKVALETMLGYWLGGNLYRPARKPASGKFPAIASPHGHWNYGRLEHSETGSIPARAINLARLGFVVLAYDMVGYNDTVQTPHAFGETKREQLWSFGPLGLQLWNSIRVVDFLESLPDVDKERIGATGASGGATQTFLLAAVDERIRFSAPVNMISAIMQGGSPCENAPGLRIGANNMEIGATMAPRPMIMVAATGDWTRNTPEEEYPAVRHIYQLLGAADKLATVQIDAPHNYNRQSREAVYAFFAQQMLGRTDASKIPERSIRLEKLQDMLVWHARALPEGALNFEGVRSLWVRRAREQNESIKDPALLRERLQLALAAEWPTGVLASRDGERIVLSRTGKGDRVGGLVLGEGAPSRLVLHPDGAEAARTSPEVKRALAAGESILLIDAFQTGAAKAPRNRSHRHFLTFNKSDDAERVQDVLTAIAWMRSAGANTVKVSATGDAAIWAVYAAAVAPVRPVLDGVAPAFNGTEPEFEAKFFVPGLLRYGGWITAKTLAGVR